MKEKVVLAYSGGLDTTAIIPWLKENFDYEVICVCVNCGQAEELDGLEERAKACGASKLYIEDVIDEFCDDYIVPCVQAHAVYENKYLLGTSMARPLIAKKLVEIARKEGAVAICHGATGKGNDQIRFDMTFLVLAPNVEIITLTRDMALSRQEEIDYLNKEPGIYSARYMGEDTPYEVKNANLLERLKGVEKEKSTARFVCAIAAVLPNKEVLTTRGTIEGYIGEKPVGKNGFGYDPIFYVEEYGCSTAELSMEQKNELSHRGKALRAVKEELKKKGF